MIVTDASAVADVLLDPGGRGAWVAERIEAGGSMHAPHLLDFEVVSVMRRLFLSGALPAERAQRALDDLRALRIARYPALALLERIWTLRENLTVYDASYIALAEALDAPLITTDRKLAEIPGHRATIHAIPS